MNEIFIPTFLILAAILFYIFQKPIISIARRVVVPKWVFGVLFVVGIPSLSTFAMVSALPSIMYNESYDLLIYMIGFPFLLVVTSVINVDLFYGEPIAQFLNMLIVSVFVSYLLNSSKELGSIYHEPHIPFFYMVFLVLSLGIPVGLLWRKRSQRYLNNVGN